MSRAKKPRFAGEAIGRAVTVLVMPQKPLTEHVRRKIETARKTLKAGEIVMVTKTGKVAVVKTSWASDAVDEIMDAILDNTAPRSRAVRQDELVALVQAVEAKVRGWIAADRKEGL